MANKDIKSKFWIRKWQKQRWSDFRSLQNGDIFDTAVKNYVQMQDRLGDIIFWYRTDKGKEGIYFVTKVISKPKQDDAYQNNYSMSLQVIKTLVGNPFIPQKNGFEDLIKKIDAKFQAGANYNILEDENPQKLWDLLVGQEKTLVKDVDISIKKEDIKILEDIKTKNINSGKLFNPFLDMNLVKHEVKHLSFLTNLLNPHGTHQQGTLFLKLLLDRILNYENQINNHFIKNFLNSNEIYVQTEKATPNGRIDIWIENDDYIIAIEGKTESKDSKNQLNKYDKYLQEKNKQYLLVYLTKFGEEPQNDYPENLLLMNFSDDIITFAQESLEVKTLPKKISTTLEEYYNSLVTYLEDFSATWTYELDIINEITKNEESYLEYEKIKNKYFHDTDKYRYSVVEDVAKIFEKVKAKIELDFLVQLTNNLNSVLAKNGFEISQDIDIDINLNDDISLNYNINIVFKKRKARTLSFENDDIDSIREKSGLQIRYYNYLQENEYLALTILQDIYGINIYFNHIKNEECVNYFERQHIELLSLNIFNSSNINKLLNDSYSQKLIDESKNKLILGLNNIEI